MSRPRPKSKSRAVPGGSQLFHRLYTRLGGHGRPPHFVVEFYPYAGLAHTIRLREHAAHVRFSDALRRAPAEVIEAAAVILLSRILRRRTPRESLEAYRRFALAPATRRCVDTLRRARARRVTGGPSGEAHDLGPCFRASTAATSPDACAARTWAGAAATGARNSASSIPLCIRSC